MTKTEDSDKRLRRLLWYIDGYTHNHGYPPKWDDMKEAMGYESKSTVHRDLNALRAGGFVDWKRGQGRLIRTVKVLVDTGFPKPDPSSPLEEAVNARLQSLADRERTMRLGVMNYADELRLRAERNPDPVSTTLRIVADELADSVDYFQRLGETK